MKMGMGKWAATDEVANTLRLTSVQLPESHSSRIHSNQPAIHCQPAFSAITITSHWHTLSRVR